MMSIQQTVKCRLLSDSEFARLDARMVDTKQRINIIHGLCSNVSKFLNFGSSVLNLA